MASWLPENLIISINGEDEATVSLHVKKYLVFHHWTWSHHGREKVTLLMAEFCHGDAASASYYVQLYKVKCVQFVKSLNSVNEMSR